MPGARTPRSSVALTHTGSNRSSDARIPLPGDELHASVTEVDPRGEAPARRRDLGDSATQLRAATTSTHTRSRKDGTRSEVSGVLQSSTGTVQRGAKRGCSTATGTSSRAKECCQTMGEKASAASTARKNVAASARRPRRASMHSAVTRQTPTAYGAGAAAGAPGAERPREGHRRVSARALDVGQQRQQVGIARQAAKADHGPGPCGKAAGHREAHRRGEPAPRRHEPDDERQRDQLERDDRAQRGARPDRRSRQRQQAASPSMSNSSTAP